jgi:hypothetical protein
VWRATSKALIHTLKLAGKGREEDHVRKELIHCRKEKILEEFSQQSRWHAYQTTSSFVSLVINGASGSW